jgi:cell wall-associated NlpC family hydrolase
MWAYAQVGITFPHFTGSQWNVGVHISRSQLRPGDLVFFFSDLHHMGMYIGNGMMVHAPHTGDVVRIAAITGDPYSVRYASPDAAMIPCKFSFPVANSLI